MGAPPRPRRHEGERPHLPNDLGPEHSGEQQHDWQYSQVLGQITQIRGAATVAPSAFGADTSGHFGMHVAATDLAHAAHLALA